MAATLIEILDALETALDAVPNLRVRTLTPDQINVSGTASVAIVPVPAIPNYRLSMGRGTYQLDVEIIVLVSAAMDRIGQRKLADFANQTGTSSIRAAIETDMTLGGVVSQAFITDFEPLGLQDVGALGYYGGTFTVRVTAPGI